MTERDNNPTDLGQYVLGLDDAVLREVAANACGCSVARVLRSDIEPREWSTYGCFTGDKVILKLSYETTDGDSGETEVYVKRQLRDPGYKETGHYQYLNSDGIPVPRFYSSHLDEQQLEVLFLENATPNRDGNRILKNAENYHAFLSIAARVNALTPEGEYGENLFCFAPQKPTDRGRRVVIELWESATNGQLGSALKKLCTSEHQKALLSLADSSSRAVPAMQRGYTIDEFTPVKIGWRHGTGEMLVCDFRTTGWGTRFIDAASWIGCPDHAQRAGYKRRELADYYFRQYLAAGGNEVPFQTLLEETHTLWQAGVLGGLSWWLDSQFKGHHSMEDDEWQAVCRERLETDLTNLLKSLPGGKKG